MTCPLQEKGLELPSLRSSTKINYVVTLLDIDRGNIFRFSHSIFTPIASQAFSSHSWSRQSPVTRCHNFEEWQLTNNDDFSTKIDDHLTWRVEDVPQSNVLDIKFTHLMANARVSGESFFSVRDPFTHAPHVSFFLFPQAAHFLRGPHEWCVKRREHRQG